MGGDVEGRVRTKVGRPYLSDGDRIYELRYPDTDKKTNQREEEEGLGARGWGWWETDFSFMIALTVIVPLLNADLHHRLDTRTPHFFLVTTVTSSTPPMCCAGHYINNLSFIPSLVRAPPSEGWPAVWVQPCSRFVFKTIYI